MKLQISFSGKVLNYLLHGQPFSLDIEVNPCWFTLVHYDSCSGKRWSIHTAKFCFTGIANTHAPRIRIWGFFWGFRKLLDKELSINFLKTREQNLSVNPVSLTLKTGKPGTVPAMQIRPTNPVLKNNRAQLKFPEASKIRNRYSIHIH